MFKITSASVSSLTESTTVPHIDIRQIEKVLNSSLDMSLELFGVKSFRSTAQYIEWELMNSAALKVYNSNLKKSQDEIITQLRMLTTLVGLLSNVDVSYQLSLLLTKYLHVLINRKFDYIIDNEFSMKMIELLIDNNADISVAEHVGSDDYMYRIINKNLIHIIIDTNNIKLFNILFKKATVRAFIMNEPEMRMIQYMVCSLRAEMFERIIEIYPAIINTKFEIDSNTYSLLYLALLSPEHYIKSYEIAFIKLLLDKGFDMSQMDDDKTILENATTFNCSSQTIKLFLEKLVQPLGHIEINYIKTKSLYKDDIELQELLALKIFTQSSRCIFMTSCLQLGFIADALNV